jgi:hypothetical protein
MDRAGAMGDWIVMVNRPSGHIACWDENLYFAKDEITFKERGYYDPAPIAYGNHLKVATAEHTAYGDVDGWLQKQRVVKTLMQ